MPNREKISVTLDPTQVREISDRVGEEYASRSEAVRALIDKGLEHDDLERENERLQRQLAAVNARQDDVTELVDDEIGLVFRRDFAVRQLIDVRPPPAMGLVSSRFRICPSV